MRAADFISKSIQEFPSLFKDVDYEKSKLKVLEHTFFTIGNGMEMADTDDIREGGYVVSPKYKRDKVTGEWARVKDKPYGKEKYKKIPKDYFDTVVYYVYGSDRPIDITLRRDEYRSSVYFRFPKRSDEDGREPRLYKAESTHPFSPYPISKDHSIVCDIFYRGVFLQEDWMEELVSLCERSLIYYNNPDEYGGNVYFPSEGRINRDLRYFQERFDKDGMKGVLDLRKTWGYASKEEVPDYTEIENRKKETWEKFHKEQINFLTKFIKKFKKING